MNGKTDMSIEHYSISESVAKVLNYKSGLQLKEKGLYVAKEDGIEDSIFYSFEEDLDYQVVEENNSVQFNIAAFETIQALETADNQNEENPVDELSIVIDNQESTLNASLLIRDTHYVMNFEGKPKIGYNTVFIVIVGDNELLGKVTIIKSENSWRLKVWTNEVIPY